MFCIDATKTRAPVQRWLPLLVLVLLLHLTLIQLAFSLFALPILRLPKPQVVNADIRLTPIGAFNAELTEKETRPSPIRKPSATIKPNTALASAKDTPESPAVSQIPLHNTPKPPEPPPSQPSPAGVDPGKQPLSLGPLPQYRASPPPSAELKYRAHSQHKGQDYYGKGSIAWVSDGKIYSAKGDFSVLFFTLLNFTSEGTVDPQHGISPTVYAEKRLRRSETNTHFHRERNTISFSASTLKYQRQGGEQDRASVVWQISGIGRHDSKRFTPGATLDIAVAGSRGADVWKFRVGVLEEIETGAGKMLAWRVTRAPHKDSFEQTFDLWLAPQLEWYPVKLRYTNANGDFLDLNLTEVAKVP